MASPVWKNIHCQLYKMKLFPVIAGRISLKPSLLTPVAKGCQSELICKAGMASARKMTIAPSKFGWTRFKNDMHFHIMLGVVPLGAIILYCNLVLGQAELADIPEGYEPKEWEYHKHPIQRWFAKYVYEDPIKNYEMAACKHVTTFEAARHNARLDRVKQMIKLDEDYRAYYFIPAVDTRPYDEMKEMKEQFLDEQKGSR